MVTEREPTDFEQVLLGLIGARPQATYDLRRFFADTPAVVYQPSAGALVPALHRLERRGLLDAEPDASSGRRARRVYHLSAAGRAAHQLWLRQPVQAATIGRDLGLHLMRFAMMERHLPRPDVLAFLSQLASAQEEFIATIEDYLDTTQLEGAHPHLALQHGIAVHRASLAWTKAAAIAIDATTKTPAEHTRPERIAIRGAPSNASTSPS